MVSSPVAGLHRDLIIRLAAEHKLPAVYSFDYYAANGGLIAYGPDPNDPFRRAADYLDGILKGAKPSDLPVQAPTSTSSSSTSRPPRRSDLPCLTPCSPAPTR